ncbi:hypothetical protein ACJX0J_009869, partial [Zea mays]
IHASVEIYYKARSYYSVGKGVIIREESATKNHCLCFLHMRVHTGYKGCLFPVSRIELWNVFSLIC